MYLEYVLTWSDVGHPLPADYGSDIDSPTVDHPDIVTSEDP